MVQIIIIAFVKYIILIKSFRQNLVVILPIATLLIKEGAMPKIRPASVDSLVYTFPQFLEAYGICKDLAYDQIRAGHLKVAKIGSRVLISKAEAERWFNSMMRQQDGIQMA